MGIVTHELGHTIGLYHTQSRYDRDHNVIVNTANIQQGTAHNFDKETADNTDNYGIPYEYGSNMHYDPFGLALLPPLRAMIFVDSPRTTRFPL